MALVHSYVRFSQTRQATGDSLDRQTRRAEAWAKQNGHALSDLTYRDLGVSSYRRRNATKGALSEFLLAIEQGKIGSGDILLIENIDRLSRAGVKPTLSLIAKIHEAKIDIGVLTPEPKVYRHDNREEELTDIITLAVQADVAYRHSQRLSDLNRQKWKKQRQQAVEKGKIIPGQASWWITREGEKWGLDKEKAKIARSIFQMAIEGSSIAHICRHLNHAGIPSPKGGHWNMPTIRHLLRNRQACGEIAFRQVDPETGDRVDTGITLKDYYPRIVDERTWQLAQSALDRRTKQRGPRGDYVFLFSGIIHNANDDSQIVLHGGTRKKNGTKIWERRLKSYKSECRTPDADTCTIDAQHFEDSFLVFCKHIDPSFLGQSNTTAEEMDLLNARLATVEKNIVEMEADIASGAAEYKALKPTIAKATQERRSLQESLKELQSAATLDARQAFGTLLEYAEDGNKREQLATAIKQVVSKIYVRSIKLGGHRAARVATCVQVVFRTGERRTFHLMKPFHVEFMRDDPFASLYIETIAHRKWQKGYLRLWNETLPILRAMAQRQEEIGDDGYVLL